MVPPDLSFVVPGPLDQRTGGYIYDRRIVEELRRGGAAVTVHELPGRYPLPDPVACEAAARLLETLPEGRLVVIDGLALPAFEAALVDHAGRLRIVAIVHHPLALERPEGNEDDRELDRAERAALAHVRRIIVTSRTTAQGLEGTEVPRARVGVVPPGCDLGGAREAPRASGPPRMLCVATMTARKGHVVLIEALARLRHRAWRLDCIGSLNREPLTHATVREAVARHRLGDRVTLHDERPADAVLPFYRRADLFVLASFHEGYGMVLAEALGFGLPIVSTTAGAIPEVVPAGAGILVPPGDVDAMRDALDHVLGDEALRDRMASVARAARFPSWSDAAVGFAAELARVAA